MAEWLQERNAMTKLSWETIFVLENLRYVWKDPPSNCPRQSIVAETEKLRAEPHDYAADSRPQPRHSSHRCQIAPVDSCYD